MEYLLLAASICLCVFKSSLYNVYAKNASPSISATFGFNAVTYGVAALVALVLLLFDKTTASLPTVLCALGYAAVVVSLQTLSIMALKVGAMSLTAIAVMYGMIIPSVAGPIFWHEPTGALQIVGICVMILSLWLLRERREGGARVAAKGWIPLALLCFLFSGMAGVMEKIHQSTQGKDEKATFVLFACLFMLLFSAVGYLVTSAKKKNDGIPVRPVLTFGAVSGLVMGFYSTVNLTLAGLLDSMIYYPVANGGAMVLTVVVSCLVFKEKFDLARICGAVIGIVGIVLLSIPV